MVRATNAVAARRRTKKLLKRCKGFYGDRKNHLKLSKDALMSALAFNYKHRKLKKRDFKSLWIVRIGVAAKIHGGMSYSKLINGLKRAGCGINRKILAELAVSDPQAFSAVVSTAKQALKAAAA
jgi:large subunit ribosomal protein L20